MLGCPLSYFLGCRICHLPVNPHIRDSHPTVTVGKRRFSLLEFHGRNPRTPPAPTSPRAEHEAPTNLLGQPFLVLNTPLNGLPFQLTLVMPVHSLTCANHLLGIWRGNYASPAFQHLYRKHRVASPILAARVPDSIPLRVF